MSEKIIDELLEYYCEITIDKNEISVFRFEDHSHFRRTGSLLQDLMFILYEVKQLEDSE